jgi:hypothetical protein
MITAAIPYMTTPRGVEFQQPDRIRWIVQGGFKGRLREIHRALVGHAIFECERFFTRCGNHIFWKKSESESEGSKKAEGYRSHGANSLFLWVSCWVFVFANNNMVVSIRLNESRAAKSANGYLWNPPEGARIDDL